jgi:hypothetical protein
MHVRKIACFFSTRRMEGEQLHGIPDFFLVKSDIFTSEVLESVV